MKKSAQAPGTWLLAVSASLMAVGCGPTVTEIRRCVDRDGFILPDSYCQGYGSIYAPNYGGRVLVGPFRYVYGGEGGLAPGGYVMHYRYTPTESATVTTPSGQTLGTVQGGQITRGGFGGSGGSFGG